MQTTGYLYIYVLNNTIQWFADVFDSLTEPQLYVIYKTILVHRKQSSFVGDTVVNPEDDFQQTKPCSMNYVKSLLL